MNPAVAAALLSRTPPAKKLEPLPKPAVGPDLVAAAGGPEALLELVRQEKLRRQQEAAVAAPEATLAPATEPSSYDTLRDLVATPGGLAALRAMARAQAMQPRPKPQKPKPVVFTPTVDSGTRRNGLSKADLDVSAKLPEQCLDRGEESEAFPGRQIVGEDDLLQLGVAQGIEVEIARQVTP